MADAILIVANADDDGDLASWSPAGLSREIHASLWRSIVHATSHIALWV
jgi:hypothetical protein